MTKKEGLAEPESGQRPTRELWRFIKFYTERIRAQSAADCKGVIRQIQRLIDKGIGLEDMALALENYANDEWRKAQDPRYTKSIRSFFTAENIKEWMTPKPKKSVRPIDRIAKFEAVERPKPVQLEPEIDDPVSSDDL
jgi:hypothetical protein